MQYLQRAPVGFERYFLTRWNFRSRRPSPEKSEFLKFARVRPSRGRTIVNMKALYYLFMGRWSSSRMSTICANPLWFTRAFRRAPVQRQAFVSNICNARQRDLIDIRARTWTDVVYSLAIWNRFLISDYDIFLLRLEFLFSLPSMSSFVLFVSPHRCYSIMGSYQTLRQSL